MNERLPHIDVTGDITVEGNVVEVNYLTRQLETLRVCFPNGFAYRALECGVTQCPETGSLRLNVYLSRGLLSAIAINWEAVE